MVKLVCRQMGRDETMLLHVMRENRGARRLHQRMGFRNCRETVVRIDSPRYALTGIRPLRKDTAITGVTLGPADPAAHVHFLERPDTRRTTAR